MHWLYRKIQTFSPEQLQKVYSQLSPDRKAYIDRLHRQEDRDRSVAAEALVYQLLEQLGVTGAQLHRRENGQPYLTGCHLHVSISHSAQVVACAVSDKPVGIDIEQIRPIKPRLCRHVCTPEEMEYVWQGQIPTDDTLCQDAAVLTRFFEIWTGKEAYFKKLGTGITDLKSVNILPLPRQQQTLEDYIVQIM